MPILIIKDMPSVWIINKLVKSNISGFSIINFKEAGRDYLNNINKKNR